MYFQNMPTMLYDFDMSRATVGCHSVTIGQPYVIVYVGDSDFTQIGASANEVGLTFIATGRTSGFGQCLPFTPENTVGSSTDVRQVLLMTDITHNVRFRKEILSNVTLYDEYDIQDGETPEMIAERVYGNPNYHWVIMLVNERYDYITDFPLSTHNLEQHIISTYGVEHIYDTHHFINYAGFIVDETDPEATSVSNYQYEDELNESKRRIKLISSELLNTILKNYKDLV